MGNIVTLYDSYKNGRSVQYPGGTEETYFYVESRGGEYPETVFFGLQYLLKKYLEGRVVTPEKIDEAEAIFLPHMGTFDRDSWQYIIDAHDGFLPISIKAVPEGTVVPVKNVLLTVHNTDPKCFWLPGVLETIILQSAWYGSTVATLSHEMRKMILKHLEKSGTPEDIDFKLHDFGFRGCSSIETAMIGGAAHLVNFRGSDTIPAIGFLHQYYGAVEMPASSVMAAEHSTITSWGRGREVDAYRNMLTQYPHGIVSVVTDSYDTMAALKWHWGSALRDAVMARDGTTVIRLDSGRPQDSVLAALNALGAAFGTTKNAKGFKELPPQVRILQGDGIDYRICHEILTLMEINGWSSNNIVFGMGGALLQRLDRDTQMFAYKCSSIVENGERRDVFKESIGKASKRGVLKLVQGDTLETVGPEDPREDLMVEVFRDGKITSEQKFSDIRARATA